MECIRFRPIDAAAAFVLVLTVARGLVPLVAGDPSYAKPAYYATAILAAILSLYGFGLACRRYGSREGTPLMSSLATVLCLNALLYAWWFVPILLFARDPDWLLAPLYTAIFPFSVFAFAALSERNLLRALTIITVLAAGFVILEFIELNSSLFADGIAAATERQELLRPGVFEAWGKTGAYIRPNGLLGYRPHDSANLLALLTTFWTGLACARRKLGYGLLAVPAAVGLLMTTSASNIVAAACGIVFLLLHRLSGPWLRAILVVALVPAVLLMTLGSFDTDFLFAWTRRVSIQYGDWDGMLRFGDWAGLPDLFALIFGHGLSLGFSGFANGTEIGFVAGFFEFGIPHYLLILGLLTFPLLMARGKGGEALWLPYVVPIAVGVLSLWHYGSLLRTTNAFVFFALYSRALVFQAQESEPGEPRSPAA